MKKSFYLVVGLGKTGLSIARYLKQRQLDFIAYDTRKKADGLADFKREFPDTSIYLEDFPPEIFNEVIAIITSPGAPLDASFFRQAFARGVVVYGDIECLAREIKSPVIAITGTNGKSTVTSLVGEMARTAGLKVAVAGNIGEPVLNLLDNKEDYDLWVLELSSFQLELTHSLKPVAATILNISPDHLDRHPSWDSYKAAKQRIYFQTKTIIYNREDKNTLPVFIGMIDHEPDIISFGLDKPDNQDWGIETVSGITFIMRGDQKILAVDAMGLKGLHNWQNALAACALAETAGISTQYLVKTLKSFTGLPHRCQWVRTLHGVEWINDSKGTNVGATCSAISGLGASMQGKLVLIAGGEGKGADFTALQSVVAQYVRAAILIGKDADKLDKALSNSTEIFHADSMEEAVLSAEQQAKTGDIVLLSPACASFDMFKDFNHRGEMFTALVNQL